MTSFLALPAVLFDFPIRLHVNLASNVGAGRWEAATFIRESVKLLEFKYAMLKNYDHAKARGEYDVMWEAGSNRHERIAESPVTFFDRWRHSETEEGKLHEVDRSLREAKRIPHCKCCGQALAVS